MQLLAILDELRRREVITLAWSRTARSSVRKLAQAYGVPPDTLEATPALEKEVLTRLRPYILAQGGAIATAFTQASDIRRLMRLGRAQGLFHHFEPRPARAARSEPLRATIAEASPYRAHASKLLPDYGAPLAHWPPDVRRQWAAYCDARQFDLRTPTLTKYTMHMRVYVGYQRLTPEARLAALPESSRATFAPDRVPPSPLYTWDELFEVARLASFVRWHAARVQVPRVSHQGWEVAKCLLTIASQAERPEFFALKKFIRKFPRPPRVHNKQHPVHTFEADELEHIGLTLMEEARLPVKPRARPASRPGLYRASRFQYGLILRLLLRTGLRARNLCEMRRPHNLYQDAQGLWWLHFEGDELKVSARRGITNVHYLPFPDDLVTALQEYWQRFRPIFPGAAADPHVFLTVNGRPLSDTVLRLSLFHHVFVRTEHKRFYPHLARTLWTDAALDATNSPDMVAAWLNNTPAVVYGHYRELRAQKQIQQAVAFNRSRFAPLTAAQPEAPAASPAGDAFAPPPRSR
jgi:integrase